MPSPHNKQLEAVLDYILNHATPDEIQVLQSAIQRKADQSNPTGAMHPGELNFQNMAKMAVGNINDRFNIPGKDQINGMTRNMVRNMIRNEEPHISEQEMEILLDKWVPDQNKVNPGREEELPLEMFMMMVKQFVAFSLGQMPENEELELKNNMGEWSKKYWDIFAPATRQLIADLLRGQIQPEVFWTKLRQIKVRAPGGPRRPGQ